MFKELLPSLRLTLVTFGLCGLLYPLGMTGAARALMPDRASGKLVMGADGQVLGSELVGQAFVGPTWFHGRVSSIGYKAEASGASNLGPTSEALAARVRSDVARARAEEGVAGALPVDLLTQSGSGLDPHVSPAAARLQAARVARSRALPEARVLALIDQHLEGRDWGLFGEPRVNVLRLNVALADMQREP